MTEGGEISRIPWQPIAPLPPTDRVGNGSLAALDALRQEWDRRLTAMPEQARTAIRHRSLRRLAVETGIIERIYDIDWGLTLTLVAEGFTKDVVERAGGRVDDRTLATLRAQMETLEMVLDFVRAERPLSVSFIKELHQAITRTQDTYVATDALGRVMETTLPRGEWKHQPNHVLRRDGRLLEYCPPEHVDAEMDSFIALWTDLDTSAVHPLVQAAWQHHRFVQIHPFADGNGRVARALTLLVLERHRYAPLVIDRWHREDYLKALDSANDGSLRDLVKLFVKLESASLAGELERPEEPTSRGLAMELGRTLADQLAALQKRQRTESERKLQTRSIALMGRLKAWFDEKRQSLIEAFRQRGVRDVKVVLDVEQPPSDKAQWFRNQVIESAHTAGHYADFRVYAGFASLRIRAKGLQLRYVASLHGAGREPGVMAVTTFGELEPYPAPEAEGQRLALLVTTKDAFRFVHTETEQDIAARAPDLEDLLDEGLAEALARLLQAT